MTQVGGTGVCSLAKPGPQACGANPRALPDLRAVPGSWLRGDVTCGQVLCRALAGTCAPTEILTRECSVCSEERKTRRRVARGPGDAAYHAQFRDAAAVFATNDVKHHVNKVRAAAFARERNTPLVMLPASAAALREKPDLKKCKKQWLKRHDRNCGSLYGLLPLCIGMPVRLTEHIDRSEKSLLKGRLGTVKGWQSRSKIDISQLGPVKVFNKSPGVVWVEFSGQNTSWRLDGVFTARSSSLPNHASSSILVAGPRPQTADASHQSSADAAAPAFALTAHSAQGMTLDGVILDFVLPPGGNVITVYIAIARVRERTKLLITRAFPLQDFQKGVRGARDLLLDCWRGNAPDIRARFNVTRRCVDCLQEKRKAFFTSPQWRASDETRVCKECVAWRREQNTPWRCSRCLQWQALSAFPAASRNNKAFWKRVCNSCHAARRCSRRDVIQARDAFSEKQWKRSTSFCRQCAYAPKQPKECFQKPRSFARARAFQASQTKLCVRAVKRQIAELLAKRQQSTPAVDARVALKQQATCPTCGTVVSAAQTERVKCVHKRGVHHATLANSEGENLDTRLSYMWNTREEFPQDRSVPRQAFTSRWKTLPVRFLAGTASSRRELCAKANPAKQHTTTVHS